MRRERPSHEELERLRKGTTAEKPTALDSSNADRVVVQRIIELSQLVLQLRNRLDAIESSLRENVTDSITSALSIKNLRDEWINASFKIRTWYLEQALSCYPELSRNLREIDRKVIASLLRGECLLSHVASETGCRWKKVSESLERLMRLDIVESKSISQRREAYCLRKDFSREIGRALRTALMLGEPIPSQNPTVS
jgi:hypothetical protein